AHRRLSGRRSRAIVDDLRHLNLRRVCLASNAEFFANLGVNRTNKIFELAFVTHCFSRCRKSNGCKSRLRLQQYCTHASPAYLGSILPASIFTAEQIDAPTASDFSVSG